MFTPLLLALGGGLTVELPTEARVRGLELTLGQIARVSGADAELVARAEAFQLGYAPAPGYQRVIDGERVAADLRRALGDVELALDGSLRCRVLAETATVPGAELTAAARRVLEERYAGQEAEIRPSAATSDLLVPAAESGAELVPELPDRAAGAGAWTVPVRVVIDGAPYRTVFTTWEVELWQTRQVLRHAVAAGSTLTAEDFETRRVRVGTGVEAHALAPEAFGHAVALRDLAAGSVVTERDVERRVLIHKGDVISLEVRRGSVLVRAIAVALAEGRAGDRVRVRCEKTGRELVAIVQTKELVTLRIQ